MKKILLVISVFLLSACTPSYETLNYPVLPDGLKDCKFYSVTAGNGSHIKVVRCPNSATSASYSQGKTTAQTAIVESDEPPVDPTIEKKQKALEKLSEEEKQLLGL